MPYDPRMVQPMRDEMTSMGAKELMTPEEVDRFLKERKGTALLFVNSVCGCAAGGARPALRMALGNDHLPDRVATVFAGQDVDATARARTYFAEMPPSSPSAALFKEGKLAFFLPRHKIEGRDPREIAHDLVSAFDQHCAKKA